MTSASVWTSLNWPRPRFRPRAATLQGREVLYSAGARRRRSARLPTSSTPMRHFFWAWQSKQERRALMPPIRAGYGITNDPYSLDRPFKYNYPTLLIQTYDAPNSFQWFTTLQQGIPAVQLPNFGNGSIPLPGAYATATINQQRYRRGYIQSWNITMQKELRYGFVAQAGYIATRSVDMQLGINLNAGQVLGAGQAGQPLYALYGRTAATTYYEPVGTNQYNSLQARLERGFSSGFQFAANYTWSKAVGVAANN